MQRCLGCMREFGEAYDVCPHCGYIVGTPPTSKTHLAPGTILQNRYTLGKVLGQGGFGITYIAWDNKIGRAVAIKEYMPNAFASRITGEKEVSCFNQEAQRQFDLGLEKTRRETNALSQFGTLESVVKVYDCIEENKTAYIIMELLRGKTVKEILAKRGKLTFAETMRIMTPVLQTLDAMHSVGMIHRDVAPDNIFVCEDGRIKLLDFGAARVVSGTDDKTLSVMLKAGYAPVEQYSGKARQGAFTDVYAASATMYKMLTGETPPDSLCRAKDDSDLQALSLTDAPQNAQKTILHGMAQDAENRIQSAKELLELLTNTAPPKKGKKGVWISCAAVFAVIVIVTAIVVHQNKINIFSESKAVQKSVDVGRAIEIQQGKNNQTIAMGDVISFGSYPQSEVKDAALIAELNAQCGTWTSYDYYSGTDSYADGNMAPSDYMQYKDVVYNNNAYRAVKFDQYRPIRTGFTSIPDNSHQDENGYTIGIIYWFQFEPLTWRVLEPDSGLVMCETIIDSQPYNNYVISFNDEYWGDADKTYYPNNYARSSIRTWLNNDFYKVSFSATEKANIRTTTLNNDGYYTLSGKSGYEKYDSPSTKDKVFLLSWNEVACNIFGFASAFTDDIARQLWVTDYAKCQGLWVSTGNKCADWHLRTAGDLSINTCFVGFWGGVNDIVSDETSVGVCPALTIRDLSLVSIDS